MTVHYAALTDETTLCGLAVAEVPEDQITDGGNEGDLEMITCPVCRARAEALLAE